MYLKVVTIVVILALTAQTYGLRCWTCYNSRGTNDCMRRGFLRTCDPNESMCFSELRNVDGYWEITKRCKQPHACNNNYIQNPRDASIMAQCNPRRKSSVCRCCCATDACNRQGLFCIDRSPMCQTVPRPINGFTRCQFKKSAKEVGSRCHFTCRKGFQLEGASESRCVRKAGKTASFTQSAPRCVPTSCPVFVVGNGQVTCSDESSIESECRVECQPGFRVVGTNPITCRNNGQWSHPPPTCQPTNCQQQIAPTNGKMNCSELTSVGSVCSFKCDDRYALVGNLSNICVDGDTPSWDRPAPLCQPILCEPKHLAPEYGSVDCDSNILYTECNFECQGGFKLEGSPQSVCLPFDQLTGIWSTPSPTCIPQLLDETEVVDNDDDVDDDDVSDDVFILDEHGHVFNFYNGSSNRDHHMNDDEGPEDVECSKLELEIENGDLVCSEGRKMGSTCIVLCDEGYVIEQSGVSGSIVCEESGDWSGSVGVCIPSSDLSLVSPTDDFLVTCQPPDVIEHVTVTCAADVTQLSPGTTCLYGCQAGYQILGDAEPLIRCQDDATWSHPVPTCVPMSCRVHKPDRNHNESMECSDSNNLDSTCGFRCDDDSGRILHPRSVSESKCVPDVETGGVKWQPEPPCCALPCPPNILADLVVVLDSSSSVKLENWYRQTNFTRQVVSRFVLGGNSARVSILRFNSKVDESTEIKLKDAQDDMERLLELFYRIPYNGRGTKTGDALAHVQERSFSLAYGNRPHVQDVVLLVTDGRATDPKRVKDVSAAMRAQGIHIFGVGIGLKEKPFQRLISMTGRKDRTFNIKNFDELLSEDFINMLGDQLCVRPCAI